MTGASKTRQNDDELVWVRDRVVKIADSLEQALEELNEVKARKCLRSLRILESQLPPCSPQQFANSIGKALARSKP